MATKQQKTTYTAAEVAVLEETILKQKAEIDELKRKLEHMNEVFANAQRARFGQSSEKNTNVNNYIILAGKPCDDLPEKCGYYGERLVLEAQAMGLNTCWAALTFHKAKVKKQIPDGEDLVLVIAIGYGAGQGSSHKSRPLESVVETTGELPDWFRAGAQAALLAPTAVNQQKFKMRIEDGEPVIRTAGIGLYTKIDLGIVKYHFELASGHKVRGI